MVLHRVRDHVAAHNWFAVAVDIAVVVAGVFLGMQASNWNAARIERADAREYRLQIIDNLRANEQDILARSLYYKQARAHSVATLAMLSQPPDKLGEKFLIDAYQGTQTWLRPINRTAYDEMIGSGLGRSIGGSPTRAKLSSYYVQVRQFDLTTLSTTQYREQLRRAMPFAAQERIRGRCDEVINTLENGVQTSRLPEECSLGLDPDLISSAVKRIKATDELEQDLTRHLADIDQKLASFARFARLARDLREHLQSLDSN